MLEIKNIFFSQGIRNRRMRVRRPRPSGRLESGKQTGCGQIGDLGRTTSADHSETSDSSGRLNPARLVASERQRGRT